jgi:hypothetical protein
MARQVLVLALVVAAPAAVSSSTSAPSSASLNDSGLTAIVAIVTFPEQVGITVYVRREWTQRPLVVLESTL